MGEEPFTSIGRIARTHGLKGEVSVVLDHAASLDAFVGLELWIVPPPARRRTARLCAARPGPKGPLFTLEGFDSIDDARELTGRQLLARTDQLPELIETEVAVELIGFAVTDERRGDLGFVTDIIVTGANDVWVVSGPLGEVLIPAIDDVVLAIDDEARSVLVRLLPGLVPEEGERA